MFTSVASQGSGLETTIMTAVSQLAHHGARGAVVGRGRGAPVCHPPRLGWTRLARPQARPALTPCLPERAPCRLPPRAGMVFVPPGYSYGAKMFDMSVPKGGSPWGASTLAGPDGSRKPTEDELGFAKHQVGFFEGRACGVLRAALHALAAHQAGQLAAFGSAARHGWL